MAYARRVYIGGGDYSASVNECTFDWNRELGCASASLTIEKAEFDSYEDIEIDDEVEIRYSSGTRWWKGIVADLQTSLNGGLTISCVGFAASVLGEVYPLGRFGTRVDVDAPSNLAGLVSATGGALAAATYYYQVSSVDEFGETLVSSQINKTTTGTESKVTLTWDEVEGAQGYRVYVGNANPWTYFDVSETTFVHDGNTTGTSIGALPAADTAAAATIASALADDVVDHLLDTYLPSNVSKGSITAGASFSLDDYDLGEGEASLRDVLKALAEIVGDTVWGVDEDGDVFFVPEATSSSKTFYIGGDVGDKNDRIVEGTSRTRSRDGVTAVRVEGNEELADPARIREIDGRVESSDDFPDATTNIGNRFFLETNLGFNKRITSSSVKATAASSTLTSAYASVQSYVEQNLEVLALKRIAMEDDGAGGYQIRAPYTEALIAKSLQLINDRIDRIQNMRNLGKAEAENLTRRKVAILRLPGVKTPALAKIAATNFIARHDPIPDRWTIVVENITTLIKPGQHMITLVTQYGDRYELAVQKVQYSFTDVARATITAGDPEYDEETEAEELKKTTQRHTIRGGVRPIWLPFSQQ